MTNVTLLSGRRYATIKETFTYQAGFREDIMSIIIDKTFLLLYGLFPLFTLPVNASFVLCFFIAICYGSFSCCVTEQKRQVGFCMLYLYLHADISGFCPFSHASNL